MVLLMKETPLINDNLYLFKEFRLIARLWLLSLSLYLVGLLSVFAAVPTVVVNCITYCGAMNFVFLTPFFSAHLTLKYQYSLTKLTETNSVSALSLTDILQGGALIQLFMQFLIDEFSQEVLLSLIEFKQFKAYAVQRLGKQINEERTTEMETDTRTMSMISTRDTTRMALSVHLPETLPQSSIVHSAPESGTSTENELKRKAFLLFKKYIRRGSELEINVDYQTRAKFNSLMEDCEEWMQSHIEVIDLIDLFDQPMAEMMRLMGYSKSRFRVDSASPIVKLTPVNTPSTPRPAAAPSVVPSVSFQE